MTIAAGHITSHNNLPQIAWVSNSPALADKARFSTLVRSSGALSQAGQAAVLMQRMLKWQKASFLTARRRTDFFSSSRRTCGGLSERKLFPTLFTNLSEILVEKKSKQNDTRCYYLVSVSSLSSFT